jgi:hypothetical protein
MYSTLSPVGNTQTFAQVVDVGSEEFTVNSSITSGLLNSVSIQIQVADRRGNYCTADIELSVWISLSSVTGSITIQGSNGHFSIDEVSASGINRCEYINFYPVQESEPYIPSDLNEFTCAYVANFLNTFISSLPCRDEYRPHYRSSIDLN